MNNHAFHAIGSGESLAHLSGQPVEVRDWIGARPEHVIVETSNDLGARHAIEYLDRHTSTQQNVVYERSDIPFSARRGEAPLFISHLAEF